MDLNTLKIKYPFDYEIIKSESLETEQE